ncbi:hypothetical protein EPK84_13170 (plasmid) [Sinorhizobium fredii]|nr:AbrB family transcriptional regulator [Sinorhizobium fredii]MQW99497.1 hypothetical protein [Sinorhizobium fredii]UTY47673.1 hypothetical protein EPK84_13170 [Sinorhizobium fredii]
MAQCSERRSRLQCSSMPVGGLAVFIVAASALGYIYFWRVAGFDHPTAFFSAMPGGVVDMVTLGLERGGDEKKIALVQTTRIILVALSLPFLIPSVAGGAPHGTRVAFVPLASFCVKDVVWFSAAVLLGVVAGRLLRLPARYLLGPMSASAIMHWD